MPPIGLREEVVNEEQAVNQAGCVSIMLVHKNTDDHELNPINTKDENSVQNLVVYMGYVMLLDEAVD